MKIDEQLRKAENFPLITLLTDNQHASEFIPSYF